MAWVFAAPLRFVADIRRPVSLRSAGYLGTWVLGYLGIWVFGYLGIWVFGYLGIWMARTIGVVLAKEAYTNAIRCTRPALTLP
jgi:hypothetical protein